MGKHIAEQEMHISEDPNEISPHTSAPVLNWREAEAGVDGQLPLQGIAAPLAAERTFIQLASLWKDDIEALDSKASCPPRVTDERALAALLLAREYGEFFTSVAWEDVQSCLDLRPHYESDWPDRTAWELCRSFANSDYFSNEGVLRLEANLNHGNSAIRIWMMELAWMVGPALKRETVITPLLENVAGTLLGVSMAWGLAERLYDSKEDLFEASQQQVVPEVFKKQYEQRIELFMKKSLPENQVEFWELESRCRQHISEAAFTVLASII